MMITDVIREAATEHEIRFLLTAYVEAVRYGDQLGALPEPMRSLPVGSVQDVALRAAALHELCAQQSASGRPAARAMGEAEEIFAAAARRLGTLEPGHRQLMA